MLSALRALVKDLKEEIIYKFYVEKVFFFKFQCFEYTIPKKMFLLWTSKQVPQGPLLAFP